MITFNRAGLTFFQQTLKKMLPQIALATKPGMTLEPGAYCHVDYTPITDEQVVVNLKPEDSVPALEEEYGTLAYFIYRDNSDKFKNFEDLFSRSEPVSIKIKKGFTHFKVYFDPETQLVSQLSFFYDGKLLAQYNYDNYKISLKSEGR